MNQDNGFQNADELYSGDNEVRPEPPSVVHLIVTALIAAASAFLMPELGFISMILHSACVIFIVSGGAAVPIQLVPVLGVMSLFFRGGYFYIAAAAAIWAASLTAGVMLRLGRSFQQALMPYILVLLSASAVGGAVFMRIRGITVSDVSEALGNIIHEMMAYAIESAGDSLPLETVYRLMEQEEAMASVAVLFIPAVFGMAVSLAGIFALRLNGLFHTLSGSELYPAVKRIATVDRAFAAVWLLSALLGVLDPVGVVGACASNIMMILLFPAVAAGLFELRVMIVARRLSGRRGLPFFVILLILSFIMMQPIVGFVILALMGTISAFTGKRGRKYEKK